MRLSAAFRLVMRDMSSENNKLGDVVQSLATSVEQVRARLEELHAPVRAKPDAVQTSNAALTTDGLPDIRSETQSLRRLLVGFRLLMKDVGGEAGRLRDVIDGLAAARVPAIPTPDQIGPARLDGLSAAVADFSGKLDEIAAAIAGQKVRDAAPALVHAAEKESLQRVLAGFRLLMRDLSGEVDALRGKVAAIDIPPAANDASVDPSLPLREAASAISIGVAETLAAIEIKLDEPLARLTEATAESAKLLQVAHRALSAPAKAPSKASPASADALVDAVSRVERAAGMIDEKVGGVDKLAAQLKRQGAGRDEALAALIGGLHEAAAGLKAESGDFLAVSAALSRDLERAAGVEDQGAPAIAPQRVAKVKKRAA
jgi:hypothetical protein